MGGDGLAQGIGPFHEMITQNLMDPFCYSVHTGHGPGDPRPSSAYAEQGEQNKQAYPYEHLVARATPTRPGDPQGLI